MTDKQIKDWLSQNGFNLVAKGDVEVVKLCLKKGMTDAVGLISSVRNDWEKFGNAPEMVSAADFLSTAILNALDQLK